MFPRHAEIDEDDDGRDRNPIADDREEPGVARVALEHQPAMGTSLEVLRPPGKKRTPAAMRAAPAPPPAESCPNHASALAAHVRLLLGADAIHGSLQFRRAERL